MTPSHASHPLIERPRLIRALSGPWKAAVFSAPAGYGKSTLAQQMAPPGRTLWCRLGPEDRDRRHLLGTLVLAGGALDPPVGRRTAQLLTSHRDMERDGALVTLTLLRELSPPRGSRLVVLDEVEHLAEARETQRWVLRLIEESGPRVRFIVTCRGSCPLPLARLEIGATVVTLRENDLEFTREEGRRLLRNGFSLAVSEKEMIALRRVVGGWAAGLIVAAKGLRRSASSPRRGEMPVPPEGLGRLFSFLAQEVYGPLPQRLRLALAKTAILDDLDEESLRFLLGPKESRYLLRELARRDLFVQVLPGAGDRPSFHPLFKSYLHGQWTELLPERSRRRLLAALARRWEKAGRWERAIRALAEAEEWHAAVRLFDRVAASDLRQSRSGTLELLAPMLVKASAPETAVAESPWVLFHAAMREIHQGRPDSALSLGRKAQDHWLQRREYESLARAAKVEALAGQITGRVMDSLERAQRLLARVPASEKLGRGSICLEVGALLLHLGQREKARRIFRRADHLLRRTPYEVDLVQARLRLAEVDFTEGRWDRYLEAAHRALPLYRRSGYAGRQQWLLTNMAEACVYLGEEDRALGYLDEASSLQERAESSYSLVLIALGRGRACSESGRFSEADRFYREAARLAAAQGSSGADGQIHVWQGVLLRRRGHLTKALRSLDRAFREFAASDAPSWLNLVRMERALVKGLRGETAEAIGELRSAASESMRLGDPKEHARNLLFQARVLMVAGRSFHNVLVKALRALAREGYLVLLRKEKDVSLPLLDQLVRMGPSPWVRRLTQALPEAISSALKEIRERPAPGPNGAGAGGSTPGPLPSGSSRISRASGSAALRIEPLHFRLLGDFIVRRGDRDLRFGRRAAENLTAYLALRPGEAVSREVLAETFWPGVSPRASRNRFDVALSTARKTLEPESGPRGPFCHIVGEGGWYRLARHGIRTDLQEHEERARRCDSVVQALTRSPWPRALPMSRRELRLTLPSLVAAVAAYGGELLPGLSYASWTTRERERLRDRHLRHLQSLGVAHLHLGDFDQACEASERLLAADPLHEDGLRTLLGALLARGDRSAALRRYRAFARRLKRELGIEPSPETVGLMQGAPVSETAG